MNPAVTGEGQRYLDSVLPIPTVTHWCSVRYYEGCRQVSETVHVPSTQSRLGVDGFCHPFSPFMTVPRLSVGHLTNLHQSRLSAQIRPQIRKGIALETDADGSMWMEFLEPYAINVQSHYLNILQGYEVLRAIVHTMTPSAPGKVKLFDLRMSRACMIEEFRTAEYSAMHTLSQLQPGTATILPPPVSVDQLMPLATTLVSFIESWQSSSTGKTQLPPCWIEIQHFAAFKMMDMLLTSGQSINQLFPEHRLYGP